MVSDPHPMIAKWYRYDTITPMWLQEIDMAHAITVRFDDEKTITGATHFALKRIAEHLGVSQNKAVHIAINRLYDQFFPEGVAHDMPTAEELAAVRGRVPHETSTHVVDSLSKVFADPQDRVRMDATMSIFSKP